VHRLRPGDRRRRRADLKRVDLDGEREINRFESVAASGRRLAPQAHVADEGLTAVVVEGAEVEL
jgi:hypothetical protein